jgi:signal transduction histidine kinase/integral membrane sensor domain MASE1
MSREEWKPRAVQGAATEMTDERAGHDRWGQGIWLAFGTLGYLALGLLGRLTIADGETLSLVWPAAGAGMLLFGLTARRRWPVVAVLVALATVALNLVTGASAAQAGIFVVSNVVQAVCGVLLLQLLSPRFRGSFGDQRLERLREFWPIVTASVISALAGALIGGLGRALLLDSWSGTDVVVWWGRNAVGCVVVVSTALLVSAAWPRLHDATHGSTLVPELKRRAPEALLLVACTAALYLSVFVWYPSVPVAFPLLAPTVWAGLRFGTLGVALHSLVVCSAVVVFTFFDRGPLASAGSWNEKVLVSQLFIGLVFCLGILLALGRGERLALTDTLTRARATSQSQADVLSTIIDSMREGVTVMDETGQVLRRNPAGAELVRTEPDRFYDARDSPFTMMTTDGQVLREDDYPWKRAIAGERVVDLDIVLVFDDGSPSRTLAVSARRLPTRDEHGLRQAVVIYHDVTADRAQRTALESFAGVVAHDLRGPLGVIDGWTEMLAQALDGREALPRAEAQPSLERIRVAAHGMNRLIDDLLDSSISREQQLRSSVVHLESLARSVAEQRAAATHASPSEIEVHRLPDAYADAALVRQLLDNLIGNAVKYVAPGSVAKVSVSGREVGEQVEVTVADEGIGIPAGERDQIFELYHRADPSDGYDGHGIGLAVCKKIVERHGGRIAARPPLGSVGTRIVFTLPTARGRR